MPKKVEFTKLAQLELDDAFEYYESQLVGLGTRFISEVNAGLQRVLSHPTSWQKITKRTRRCLLHNFPFGLIYTVNNNSIVIIAVANLHRKPEYWIDRLGG
ncbi:type II toxin-antitoxin system RelE/ParE family toxin [Planctobacterium marinum]|nr:type II toxin-antitoxin system RelE/ParE family toxin [Planctobacterium marinum]